MKQPREMLKNLVELIYVLNVTQDSPVHIWILQNTNLRYSFHERPTNLLDNVSTLPHSLQKIDSAFPLIFTGLKMKKVAVVGAGVSGLVAAYTLAKAGIHVVLYEKEASLGGHARTVCVNGINMDLGFMVCNRVTYSNTLVFLEELGVELEPSDMSFAVSVENGNGTRCEWASKNGLAGLFAQKRNAMRPAFWHMLWEIFKFKTDVLQYLDDVKNNEMFAKNDTLEDFIQMHAYSREFQDYYLIPMCASIWSCSSKQVRGFSAVSVLSFCHNHHLLQIFGRPQWFTIKDRSHTYVRKVSEELNKRFCEIKTNCAVHQISTSQQGVLVYADGSKEVYDGCIIGTHAPDALNLLGQTATYDEHRILGAFHYAFSNIHLHHDKEFMPKNLAAWSSWNFLGSTDTSLCVTYWLNILQNLGDTDLPYLVTLNPSHPPQHNITTWSASHPIPSPAAEQAAKELDTIQGKRGIWYCGAYQGVGFHEDGVKAGLKAAYNFLGNGHHILPDTKPMTLSWRETGARLVVVKFLQQYIQTDRLLLKEDGGTIMQFEGNNKKGSKKSILQIHQPAFYWKIATRADLGLADAYIDADFSCVDVEEGLLNLLLILVRNRDGSHKTKSQQGRGWWTPMLSTALHSSGFLFLRHISRRNSIMQTRKNISQHYDLSNDMFSLFLDETMTYSCAIFKEPTEPLKDAQMRKIQLLIEKARIDRSHEVLEIGCGWGSLALEVVKQTGCKYTGLTLSKKQLSFATRRVKEAGLEDHITLLLCDYREVSGFGKYNRIISCEMLEGVGHEYLEAFFRTCDNLLAEDGIVVLQFISIPDQRYDEYRRSSDFIKEYIFPGGCLPSFSRLTSAMAAASKLCVEHSENIGIHYYHTLMRWRKNLHANKSGLLKLGFGETFIRTWDYYFVYCAAGFKSLTLMNYQVVLSRPGNSATRTPVISVSSILRDTEVCNS